MAGGDNDSSEIGNFSISGFLDASDEMDAYLDSARKLFEIGVDGGREGIIRYLSASISLIQASDLKGKRSVAPLYVLINALRGLSRNIIHPVVAPDGPAGRPKGSHLRDFVIAWSVCVADWLKEIGFKRAASDEAVARRLDGKLPPEHAADRITGTTIRNWRAAINRGAPGNYLRDTYQYLVQEKPTFIMNKSRKQAHDGLLKILDDIVHSLRPADL